MNWKGRRAEHEVCALLSVVRHVALLRLHPNDVCGGGCIEWYQATGTEIHLWRLSKDVIMLARFLPCADIYTTQHIT